MSFWLGLERDIRKRKKPGKCKECGNKLSKYNLGGRCFACIESDKIAFDKLKMESLKKYFQPETKKEEVMTLEELVRKRMGLAQDVEIMDIEVIFTVKATAANLSLGSANPPTLGDTPQIDPPSAAKKNRRGRVKGSKNKPRTEKVDSEVVPGGSIDHG